MPKLRDCPSCGNKVSTQASSCPKCGHQFKAAGGINLRDPVHVIGLILTLIIAAAVVFGIYIGVTS